MIVNIENREFFYETEKTVRIFLPFEKIEFNKEISNTQTRYLIVELKEQNQNEICYIKLHIDEKTEELQIKLKGALPKELEILKGVFLCFAKICGYVPPYGMLTGVRPTRLYSKTREKLGEENADKLFLNEYMVNKNKLSLLKTTADFLKITDGFNTKKSVSIYISVPFCPSRCSYCSFVSEQIGRAEHLIPQYVENLCEEIKITADIVKEYNLEVKTLYLGGGTPTTLSAEQLNKILSTAHKAFNFKNLLEVTVEAGRPDTITKEKLLSIKDFATRICINPQTMHNDVLEAIGRKHTVERFFEAFDLARSLNFKNINLDLIAGLKNDTVCKFTQSIQTAVKLNPEAVTVHSLSIKRAASLNKNAFYEFNQGLAAAEMVTNAYNILTKNNYNPYYLYRQSKTVGNLENIGYSKKGYEGLYNTYIMDETHSVLGIGAGAVTKLKDQNSFKIERVQNYKYPYEYISDFNEIIKRKDKIKEFYNAYNR